MEIILFAVLIFLSTQSAYATDLLDTVIIDITDCILILKIMIMAGLSMWGAKKAKQIAGG